MKKSLASIVTTVFLLLFASTQAWAILLNFSNITGNNATNAATGESQLFVDLTSVDPTHISFRFFNNGPLASSIADVYFDDGTLLGISSLIDADDGVGGDAGVDFSIGASPPNLPGGNGLAIPFVTTAGFLADSDAPAQPNGVNPNEELFVIFELLAGKTFADTVAALSADPSDPNLDSLRIGIHVQGFANGGSESFINVPPNGGPPPQKIPEPGIIFLLGAGLLGVCLSRRRRT